MKNAKSLSKQVHQVLGQLVESSIIDANELTIEVLPSKICEVMTVLRDDDILQFNQLMDICGIDYLLYGEYDWETETATKSGFSRGVESQEEKVNAIEKPRFAVVYHLLSTVFNHRIRVKAFLPDEQLSIESVNSIWKSANWFEREAYDLYGILFINHPDLRRILTDYGFIGHPFRKDFPLSGNVEMRYDAKLKKVIYEQVDIDPRITVPKVIRNDNRYIDIKNGSDS